ncbi:MAG: putative 60 kDa chaperonin [Prokaryotic dsDNA virus sp.]|mgnify:CR=1 FL=1|nr:MAG: putative 60 kDa chaperonin [Prokaryotic dsDNA virus sp.]|tara:strand:- start:51146 stop:52726 length:1581 start_codon:yes stop_codon:yes gene_type:complete
MKDQGYIPKDLSFDDKARTKLISGISKISNAVKSTLGPQGQTVLIESTQHTQGLTVTKDGVTVAKSIFLLDPVENLAVRMMKQASEKTANTAGDGTTTAIVLTEALVKAGQKYIKEGENTIKVVRAIREAGDKLLERIKEESVDVTDDMLKDIATISANNDNEIGEIIAKAYKEVGRDGIVTVERSQTDETYAEVTNGIKVDRGWTSPMFINDQRKDECIYEDVKVLICDSEINNILQIENVLKPIINAGEKLLIIGDCSGNVINTLAANVQRNGLKFCNIVPPSFGYKTHELMQDIAFAVGAKYFSEKTGDDLSLIRMEDLGHADKIIVGKDNTIIIKNGEITKETIARVDELRDQQERLTAKHEKDFINERIASLVGGIGCIQVGATSDIEQKEKFDRVDDSVCAVRSALQEGIVAGGGLLLNTLSKELKGKSTADKILKETLQAPLQQILVNAGLNKKDIYEEDLKKNFGYNVVTGKYGDMFEMGVVDPAKVTIQALSNAISVATTILTTNAIITHARIGQDD